MEEMKPYELTEEERDSFTDWEEFDTEGCAHAAQKTLLEYLNEPCVKHPMTFINTGEKTYSEKRAWCGQCLESLLKDFGL